MEPILKLHKLKKSPIRTHISDKAEQNAWCEILNRLTAYTAWCLWSDKHFYDELSRKDNLDAIWNPNPAHAIAKNSNELKAFEAIFGPLNLETTNKLKWKRDRQEKMAKEAISRIESWLGHPGLKSWYKKINETYRKERGELSFYGLFDERDKKTRQRLNSLEMGFGYLLYKTSSMVIHGSTIDQLLFFNGNKLVPKFVGSDTETKSSASFVGSECNGINVGLQLMQKHVW